MGIKVFGHRGACGYRPENTLESFRLAFDQGVDAIECDLIPSKDGHLIIRHDNFLSTTTDVASRPEFAHHKRDGVVGWNERREDWFCEDFTLAELKQLRAIERFTDLRPGSAKFDGQFEIPTLMELLNADFVEGRHLILEIKHGAYFAERGFPVSAMLSRDINASGYEKRGIKLTLESFDFKVLDQMQRVCGEIGEYVFLVDTWGEPRLDECARLFDGVSFNHVLTHDGVLIEEAKARGLLVYLWTAKAEEAENSVEEYYAKFVLSGADGVFADQPDLLVDVNNGLLP